MRRTARRLGGLGEAILLVTAIPSLAHAGGFELPDNGTEALGRGGAFTAKADDPTAIQYNVAGLARQRGTRLLFNANLLFNDYTFQRSGSYPDNPQDPKTPWGGSLYPSVSNQGAPFFAPFVAATSDFGLDRLTFAIGAFGPSAVGNKLYPRGVQGAPAASRYDVVQPNTLVVLPTIAAGFRATKEFDVGLALHAVYGSFDLTTVSFTDVSRGVCKNVEYQPCDATNRLQTTGFGYAASVGAMWRPDSWLQLGLNVRTPISLDTTGTVTANPPTAIPAPVQPEPATFSTKLPWVIRGGGRIVFMEKAFERGDIEVDATYETWGSAQGDGPKIDIPELSLFKDIHATVSHNYNDTYSVRGGAAYNWNMLGGVMTLRGGAYYDSSATAPSATRLDFDTREKIGATAGLGLRIGGITVNVAYAEIFSPDRVVIDGTLRPINGAKNGSSASSTGDPLPTVNSGIYTGHTRILSMGVQVRWDVLLGKRRVVHFGDSEYEDVTAALPEASKPAAQEAAPAAATETKRERDSDAAPKKEPKAPSKPGKKESDWDK